MTIPSPGQSYFVVHWSSGTDTIPCQYNPTQITLEKAVQLAEIGIPGLTAPLQQFVRGQAETLTIELMFDTSEKGGMGAGAVSVATLTDPFYSMARIEPDGHAPPVVEFFWGSGFPGSSLPAKQQKQARQSFTGVVSNIRQVFTLWSTLGVPLRAKLTFTIKEYAPLDDQLAKLNLNSPDKTHSHVTAAGETLSAISHRYYLDSLAWRKIADENGIDDPRRLAVGRQLTVPSIPVS